MGLRGLRGGDLRLASPLFGEEDTLAAQKQVHFYTEVTLSSDVTYHVNV